MSANCVISTSSLIFWGLTQFNPSRNCNTALRENWLRCIWATWLHFWLHFGCKQVYILVRFLQTRVNQLGFTWKWGMLNTAVTNMLQFCSSGRGCSSLPFTKCSAHPEQCATKVPLWRVEAVLVVGIVIHFRGWNSHLHYLKQWCSTFLRSVTAQGCQATPAMSDCVYSAEGAPWFLFHQLGGKPSSPQSSCQCDRGMGEEHDVVLANVTKGGVQYNTGKKFSGLVWLTLLRYTEYL